MPATEQPRERRRYVRVPARGEVVFHRLGNEIHGRIVVVSDASLEVGCQLGFSIVDMLDQPVELTVSLENTTWTLLGRVRFVRAERHSLVIEYDAPAPALARAIRHYMETAGEDATGLQLMLLAKDHDEQERTRIAGEDARGRRQEPS